MYTPPRVRRGRFAKKPTPYKASPPQSTSDSGTDDIDTDTTDDTGVCEECDGCYKDDSQSTKKCWIGCDCCDLWYRYQCVGLKGIPGHAVTVFEVF